MDNLYKCSDISELIKDDFIIDKMHTQQLLHTFQSKPNLSH